MPLFDRSDARPHYLLELSAKELSNIKDNTITIQGISFYKDTSNGPIITSYISIQYGSNLTPSIMKILTTMSGAKVDRHEIQVCKIKHRYLIITTDKIEYVKHVSMLDTSFRNNTDNLEGKNINHQMLYFCSWLY